MHPIDDDDDDDEVVGEIDLFLSQPPPSSELHLLQYPLRHAQVGIGQDRHVTGVNIRPKHGRIEIKLAVHPTLPTEVDEMESSFDMHQTLAAEKAIGMEQTLRSKPNFAAPHSNYGLGCFIPAEKSSAGRHAFTIVPVKSVVQLRPAFDYLDKHDMDVMRQKMVEKAAKATARGMEVKRQTEEEEDVAPLQVSFRRRETERAVERRKNSHATLRQKEEDEAWINVNFLTAADCVNRKNGLFNVNRDTIVKRESVHDMNTTYTDLYYSHTRHVRAGLVAKGSVVTNTEPLSARALKMLPTESAVAQAVTYARLVGFRDLLRLVGEMKPVNEVLSALRIMAVCLRGCWVAKKGLKNGFEKIKSTEERYEASRFLVLDLFRRQRIVTEKMAIDALGERMLISEVTLQSILKEVAEFRRGHGWEFRLEDDPHFVAQYANLCAVQEQDWDERIATSRETLAKVKR